MAAAAAAAVADVVVGRHGTASLLVAAAAAAAAPLNSGGAGVPMPFRVAAVAAAAAADGMALDLIDLRLWLKQLRQPVLMSLLRGGPGVPALLVTSSLQRRPQLPVMVQIVFIGLRVWLRQLRPPVLIGCWGRGMWSCLAAAGGRCCGLRSCRCSGGGAFSGRSWWLQQLRPPISKRSWRGGVELKPLLVPAAACVARSGHRSCLDIWRGRCGGR